MSARYLFGLLVLCLAVGIFWAQEKKPEEKAASGTAASGEAAVEPVHPAKITDEDKARKNPAKFTTVSVERGKKIFNTQCAMCHGETGDGKGEAVAEMKINPPDFTKPETLKDRTDGELFAIMGAGSEVMPGQGTRMTDIHKWNMVNFLRSVSGKVPEKATGKEPEENVILVPQ
jgi:mono/diheme cytochrome c family protein